MQGFIKTIINAIQAWTTGKIKESIRNSIADWNENDINKDSYIKNRPFGETTKLIEIIPEQSFISGDFDDFYAAYDPKLFDIKENTKYKIIFNDINYYVNSDEHRNIQDNNCSCNILDGIILWPKELGQTITFALYEVQEIVHKLDPKYLDLPANIATTDEVQNALDVANEAIGIKMDKENPVGTGSFSMNRKANTTIGDYSHAEGYRTIASGIGSHAEGSDTEASGEASHAEGYDTTASGKYSHTEGTFTIASGNYSHAEGFITKASGNYSHAEGGSDHNAVYTEASGNYSHAEGYRTKASGLAAHSEGSNTTASGDYSHVEGNGTKASGDYSHAEGYHTTASGDYSHAEGYYTIAQTKSQHVQGECNILDTEGSTTTRGKYAHIVGNGTDWNIRSNAHTLDWDGNAWYQGDVYVGGSGQNDENAKILATQEYVDDALANIDVITSWNDVEDKPFGEESGLVEILPETTLDFEFISLGGIGVTEGQYEAMADIPSFVDGQEYIIVWDGVEYKTTARLDDYSDYILGNQFLSVAGGEDTGEPFGIVQDEIYGSYIYATSESTHTISILTQGIVVKQIDEKFIPDNIARISAAAVGQTIAVKAVDEDGKPTEWEAINIADPEWKVIKTLTLTEDAETVVIDKDDNGNSFSLRECIMYIEAKATASAPIEYIPNGYWTAGNYTPSAQKTATDYPYKFAIHCYGKTGEYFWGHEIMSKSQPSGNSYRMHTENGTVKKAPITSFKLTGKFATGAVFVLYGKESNE